VLVICLRAKWDALNELVSETALAMCFMIIGLLINEVTGIFIAIKHKLMIVYAFAGFFIAEFIRPKGLGDALGELKRKQTADPIQPATEGERSEERSSAGVITQKDELLSNRLTARTLAEYETEQPRLMSAQAENPQLQEKIDNVRDHLEMNEIQLKQSTVRIQEAVGLSATLQREFAALKQQLVESEHAIETLQSAVRIQSESQGLSFENQRLQEEVESHRIQLNTSDTRLRELARRNQVVSDRYEHLETEVADLNRRLEDSQSKDREIETARQPLANVEFREMVYRERQQRLERRIVDLERELSKGMNQVQVRDDTLQRLRETERVCQKLTEENRRLWERVSLWQERLAASEATQRQVSLLRQQIYALQSEYARLMNGERQAQAEFPASGDPIAVSRPVSDFNDRMVMQTTANTGAELSLDRGRLWSANVHQRMPFAIAISETKSLNKGSQEPRGDQSHSAVRIHLEKEEDANWVVWPSVKRQWRFGAVAATVVMIAGAVITGVLETRFSASKKVVVAPETSFPKYAVETVSESLKQPAPETSSQEYTVEAVSRRQKKIVPRLQGTFETVRPTQVYDGPSENSAWIADISAGMKLNVVNSTFGWLEIRSMHGRPPGFVRQEAAVSIARN
jgi:chromosome segregation ATPase